MPPNELPRLSELLKERAPSFEESTGRAERAGLEAANAYTAGYWRAIEELAKLEDERGQS